MLGHKELALVLVLFWVGWMGLTDKSVDAKVSFGKVPGGERKSFKSLSYAVAVDLKL